MILIMLLFFSKMKSQDSSELYSNYQKKNSSTDSSHNVVWKGTGNQIKVSDIAAMAAPILWFSPDEPSLGNYIKNGISIPEPFPFEKPSAKPVVYYKILTVVGNSKEAKNKSFTNDKQIKAMLRLI